jgi:hypothetical protein
MLRIFAVSAVALLDTRNAVWSINCKPNAKCSPCLISDVYTGLSVMSPLLPTLFNTKLFLLCLDECK